jgi:hypothetical protein
MYCLYLYPLPVVTELSIASVQVNMNPSGSMLPSASHAPCSEGAVAREAGSEGGSSEVSSSERSGSHATGRRPQGNSGQDYTTILGSKLPHF